MYSNKTKRYEEDEITNQGEYVAPTSSQELLRRASEIYAHGVRNQQEQDLLNQARRITDPSRYAREQEVHTIPEDESPPIQLPINLNSMMDFRMRLALIQSRARQEVDAHYVATGEVYGPQPTNTDGAMHTSDYYTTFQPSARARQAREQKVQRDAILSRSAAVEAAASVVRHYGNALGQLSNVTPMAAAIATAVAPMAPGMIPHPRRRGLN
jgi:hypothetical protein